MPLRDVTIDPRPGDVLRDAPGNTVVVTARSETTVTYTLSSIRWWTEGSELPLAKWAKTKGTGVVLWRGAA